MIEVGEYVRTKKGKIFKYGKGRAYLGKDNEIVKHSKNIIVLIEAGDFVNKEEIIEVRKQNGKIYLMTSYCPQNYIKHEIKEILTKEQYTQNCYTVERKEEC